MTFAVRLFYRELKVESLPCPSHLSNRPRVNLAKGDSSFLNKESEEIEDRQMEMDIFHGGKNNCAVLNCIFMLPQENYELAVGLSGHILPTDKSSHK